MSHDDVNHGLPVGPPAAARSTPVAFPPHEELAGRRVRLVPLRRAHAAPLFRHLGGRANIWRWTYMFAGGWVDAAACEATVRAWCAGTDAQFYAVVKQETREPKPSRGDEADEAVGVASLMSVVPAHRRLEMGTIILGDAVRGSAAATEAFWLLLARAFGLGYERVEWKADALNAKSLQAAQRLGFSFEGVFR